MIHTQVITFDNITSDNLKECNDFLKTIPETRVVSVTPIYNTIVGGLIYVVVYYR